MNNENTQKIIVVNATAIITGGALSILKQFLTHITDQHIYYIFVHPSLNFNEENSNIHVTPQVRHSEQSEGSPESGFVHVYGDPSRKRRAQDDVSGELHIHFIKINATTILKRIFWDSFGLKRWLKKREIIPDLILSLQNTSVSYDKATPKIIYLHQSLPLHHKSWSFLKKGERKFAFYKYLYPLFIFLHVDRKTKFVVQTEWMKTALCRRFFQNKDKVLVIKPDIVRKNIANIPVKELPYQYTLFYPATSALFKNHKEIILALKEIRNLVDISHIGLYLTINEDDDKELAELVNALDLKKNVQFLGPVSYEDVLCYYKSCSTVVFPSYIESFGLPLLEAALFGKPLVAIDESYAEEVISGYPGVIFVPQNSPEKWMRAILHSFENTNHVPYLPDYQTGWSDFFELIYDEMNSEKMVLNNIKNSA